MLEMKISITAAELAAAINNLAAAIDGKRTAAMDKSATSVVSATVAQSAVPTPNVNPTPAQQVAPTGTPLSATPTQIGAPAADSVPVAPVMPAAPVAAPAAPVVPTSAPGYTLEMIATAGSSLIDAGKLNALMALLGKYGVDSLTNLSPEHYAAIAMDLRALGARI